jgi:hypothetical protein
MMRRILPVLFFLFLIGTVLAAPADRDCASRFTVEFKETFADRSNEGNWSFCNGCDVILDSGGNPKWYLFAGTLDTFAPITRTLAGVFSEFTGNYRARGVFSVGSDFRILTNELTFPPTTAGRPLSVMFINFNGTKETDDDLYVYFVGSKNIPEVDTKPPKGKWEKYDFSVPSDSPTVPLPLSTVEGEPGWVVTEGDVFTPPADPDAVWNTVMEQVDQLVFWFHDPRFFAIFQQWDVGMDNPRISTCTD